MTTSISSEPKKEKNQIVHKTKWVIEQMLFSDHKHKVDEERYHKHKYNY